MFWLKMHRSLHKSQSLNFLGFLLCLCSSCSQKEPLSCGSHGIFLGSFSPGVGGHNLVLDGTRGDCNNGVNSGDTLLMSLNAQQPSRHEDQGTEPPDCCLWVSFHPWDDFRGTEALQGQLEVQGCGCRAVHSHKDSSKDFLGEAVSPLLFFRGDVQNCRNNQEGEGKFFLLLTSLGAVVPQVFLPGGDGSQKDLAEHFHP